MYTHPGTKLVFMGGEFGQTTEWDHDQQIRWDLLDHEPHRGLHDLTRDLNKLYKSEPALYENSFSAEGFEWIELNDYQNSVLSYMRKGKNKENDIAVVCNFTPVVREEYRMGIEAGDWEEILNTDSNQYWGSGVHNEEILSSEGIPQHGRTNSLKLSIPPLAAVVLRKKKVMETKTEPKTKRTKRTAAKNKTKKK